MQSNRERLRLILRLAINEISEEAKALSRDRREPARREKLKVEFRLRRLILRYFRAQRQQILQAVELSMPERKAIWDVEAWVNSIFGIDERAKDKLNADVMRLVLAATNGGVDLFRRNAAIELDYTQINANASAAVQQYVGDLISNIDKTTRETVRQAVQQFVDTPGMTIGDLRNALPFNAQRANTIAVTEVTRAYGEGERVAGEALREQFPDVKVVKKWYTNEDDKVCPLCGPLGDADRWIPIDKAFDIDRRTGEMYMNPPRHVNCRCWIATRTDING